jgi:hypothetical protein
MTVMITAIRRKAGEVDGKNLRRFWRRPEVEAIPMRWFEELHRRKPDFPGDLHLGQKRRLES